MAAPKSRSADRQAEVKVMDAIERAMARVDDLPDRSQRRVRAWVAEEFADPWALIDGQAPSDPGGDKT